MNVFCRLFGHTWVPETRAPQVRWNTTKDGHVLGPTIEPPGGPAAGAPAIRHLEVCRRCNAERESGPRRHDADQPHPETVVVGTLAPEE